MTHAALLGPASGFRAPPAGEPLSSSDAPPFVTMGFCLARLSPVGLAADSAESVTPHTFDGTSRWAPATALSFRRRPFSRWERHGCEVPHAAAGSVSVATRIRKCAPRIRIQRGCRTTTRTRDPTLVSRPCGGPPRRTSGCSSFAEIDRSPACRSLDSTDRAAPRPSAPPNITSDCRPLCWTLQPERSGSCPNRAYPNTRSRGSCVPFDFAGQARSRRNENLNAKRCAWREAGDSSALTIP